MGGGKPDDQGGAGDEAGKSARRATVTRGLPYFAVYADVVRHPKVSELGRLVGSRPAALGYLLGLWAFTAEFYGDGKVPNRPGVVEDLERTAGWTGPPGELVQALAKCRFLDVSAHRLTVHAWHEYQGPHVARRERERGKKRRNRAKVKGSCPEDRAARDRQDRDRDREGELDQQPASHSDQRPLVAAETEAGWPARDSQGDDNDLTAFRSELGRRLAVPELGIGRDPENVLRFFREQLQAVGQEALLSDCEKLATRSKNGTPANLAWFVGWLRRLPMPAAGSAP